MSRTLGDLFFCPNSVGENVVIFDQLCTRLQQKAQTLGLNSLSEPARIVLLAYCYDVGMFRSGWYTLMYWDKYDVMDMIPALEAIGARTAAQILREVASLFPTGTIPASVALRNKQYNEHVEPLYEARLESLNKQLGEVEFSTEQVSVLAEQFALAHRAELVKEEA